MRYNYIQIMDSATQAYLTIKKQLESSNWIPGERLPSLQELARMCSVSRSTMWRSIQRLKKESLVHARRGGSIIAGTENSSLISPKQPGLAWEKLRDRIGRDLLTGIFSDDPLPPLSKTALRYGLAIDTVKKALAGLVGQGVLAKTGRRYRRIAGRIQTRRSSMVLISAGDPDEGVTITDPRTEHVVEAFERECFRLGFRSHCEGFNSHDPRSLLKIMERIRRLGDTAGFIVNLWMDWTEDYRRRWTDLLGALANRDVPVVVMDQDGALSFPDLLLRHPRFRVLRIAGVRAGEAMGQLLIRQGHRQVAFLMPGQSSSWAQNRYKGLVQSFKSLGGSETAIQPFLQDELTDTNDLILAVLGLNEEELAAVYQKRLSAEELPPFTARLRQEKWLRLKEKLPVDPAYKSINAIARFLIDFPRISTKPWIDSYMLDALIHIASNTAGEHYLAPFFENVFQKSRATVWVCAEDKTAIWALAFLRNKGIAVPENISVIGFENWREAHEQQLSSYDFNMNGMIQQALYLVLDPKALKSSLVISEVDGYTVERRTTRR